MTALRNAAARAMALAAIATATVGAAIYLAALEARAYIADRPEPTLADRVERAIQLERRRRRT